MKNFYFSLLLSLAASTLYAQTNLIQNGIVREFNSGKKTVADVQIIYSNAPPAFSDASGKFQLNFTDKKASDLAFRADIAKKDYELVNEKELEHLKLSSNNGQLNTDVLVAKIGAISQSQKDYAAFIESILKTNFDIEKDVLKKALQSRQILKEAYYDQYGDLQKQYSAQKRGIYQLSEKFAKINLDDAQLFYKEMVELFKDGQMQNALKRMENAGLIDALSNYFKEKKKIKDGADSIKFIAKNGHLLSDNLALLNMQSDFYALSFNKPKSEAIYEQIFVFDSTDLDILRGCAEFYKTNNAYEKAVTMYAKILAHPKIDIDLKRQAFLDGGDVLMAIGQSEDALNAYNSAKNIVSPWVNKENMNAPFIKHELGVIYSKAGTACLTLANTDKALVFFRSFNRLQQEILTFYPNNLTFKKGLANSFERLGKLHVNTGDLAKSIEFFETNKQLRKAIYEADLANLEAKENLAAAFEKLGNVQMSLNFADKALLNFEQYFALKNDIFAEDRLNIEAKNNLALAFSKIGSTYSVLNKFDKALVAYIDYNRLLRELLTENMSNPDVKSSLAVSFTRLAETHLSLNNSSKALMYYEERLKLNKELAESYPSNVAYKNNLSVIYSKIGNIYNTTGDVDLALAYYMKDTDVSKELYANAPNNVHFKNSLAISYSKLGTFYKEKKSDIKQAHVYFEKSKLLLSELSTNAPNSADYKNNLRIVEAKLTEK